MKDASKIIVKVVLWLVLILIVLSLFATGFGVLKEKFNWFAEEQVDIPFNIEDGLSNSAFGELTSLQIEAAMNDDDTPYCDDIFQNMFIRDTGKYVVFYRELISSDNKVTYPNISFVKTSKGLVWDGAFGVKAKVNTNWLTGKRDIVNAKFELTDTINFDYSVENPNVLMSLLDALSLNIFKLSKFRENIVTFSDFQPSFCEDFFNVNSFILNFGGVPRSDIAKLKEITRIYLKENVLVPYFMNFGSAQMFADITSSDTAVNDLNAMAKFNSYYNYLYTNCKNLKTNENKMLNSNGYFVAVIPDELRNQFPIPEEKRAAYSNLEFYPIYKCDIVANCYYTYAEISIERDDDKIEKEIKDLSIYPPPVEIIVNAKLTIELNNIKSADLSNFNMKENPVIFKIDNKQIKFDSLTEKVISLEKYKTYNYEIISQFLVFSSYSGKVEITKNSNILKFDFEYNNGFVNVGVKITPSLNVDLTSFNLQDSPVNIVFISEDNNLTYEIKLTDNIDIGSYQYLNMQIGKYTYTILSQKLIFSSSNGKVEITAKDRMLNYPFVINQSVVSSDLKLNIERLSKTSSGNNFMVFNFSSESMSLLKSKYTDNEIYFTCNLYNQNKELIDTCRQKVELNFASFTFAFDLPTGYEDNGYFDIEFGYENTKLLVSPAFEFELQYGYEYQIYIVVQENII